MRPRSAGPGRRSGRVVLGRFSGVFGVSGWLKLWSYADPPSAILDYREWQVRPPAGPPDRLLEPIASRAHGKGFVVQLAGVGDRDAAAALVGSEIAVDRADMPEPAEGEYYWVDLVGLTVETVDGVALGRVQRLMETGANDVLVVQGDRERLVPFVLEQVVKDVDLESGRIRVDWDPDF